MGSTSFDEFCEALSKPIGRSPDIAALPIGHEDRLLTLWEDQKIDFSVLNYAQWIREVRLVSILLFGGNETDIRLNTSISEKSEALP